jgi:hypothetical protein
MTLTNAYRPSGDQPVLQDSPLGPLPPLVPMPESQNFLDVPSDRSAYTMQVDVRTL